MDPWEFKPAKDLELAGMDRMRSYRRETGLTASVIRLLWWGFLRVFFRTWNRLQVEGRGNLPAETPFLLASNHSSHLDAMLLMSVFPISWRDRVFPIVAKDVFFEKTSVAAFGAYFINALPLWRNKAHAHDLSDLRAILEKDPVAFILFPEGTRSRTGEMQEFKPGIGRIVAGTRVPVVPCWIEGAHAAMPPGAILPRPKKLRLVIGKPLDFHDTPDKREGWSCVARETGDAVGQLRLHRDARSI
jgi:1-acyl-sn-glycerol-3-phosphate acyltransferase